MAIENKRVEDALVLVASILMMIVALAVSVLVLTWIFSWVADVVNNGYAVIGSVALVMSSAMISAALIFRKKSS
ncbi:MAG: hypothetical protein PUK31_02780 [Candidatus Methanomethylophilaceae archaeon]|nr:hypothetical protein [Candidatus Methanomethylophilaceae archaeon]MDY5873146.1 hypothetical protein [Candidatus Methanomethylophilaceae archaeon]